MDVEAEQFEHGDPFVDARNACVAELRIIRDGVAFSRLKEPWNQAAALRIVNECRTRLREIGDELYQHRRKLAKRLARRHPIEMLTQAEAV